MLQIFNWLRDPKNRGILKLAAIAILIAIILMQCSKTSGLLADIEKQKTEAQRQTNNNEVKNAPLTQTQINDSTVRAEKLALKLTIDELKKSNSDLLIGFEDFKKQNPKTIEKITFHETETVKQVLVYVKLDSLGKGSFSFSDTLNFADGNYTKLRGNLPFSSSFFNKKDSTQVDENKVGLFTKIKPGPANFILEQGMHLKVGLFEDPKTGKVKIAATTSFPGVTFTQLDGADIMSDGISRKAARQLRKEWGIGLHLGYGVAVDLKTSQVFLGPQMGVGITYTPKWLQWGK